MAPHFLMELHLSLICAVPNALYLEHIPQLRAVTTTEIDIRESRAQAPSSLGFGIESNLDAIDDLGVG